MGGGGGLKGVTANQQVSVLHSRKMQASPHEVQAREKRGKKRKRMRGKRKDVYGCRVRDK